MKRIVIVLMAVGFFWACKDQGPVRYTVTSAEIDQSKALIAEYEKGDWEAWMSHYADTAKVYHNSNTAATAAEALEVHKGALTNVSDYGFSDEDQYVEMIIDDKGETWVYFWGTWEGTLSANGNKMELPVHLAMQFVDNKIVKEHGYWDNMPMSEAIRAIEAAAMTEEE
ncbi:MAG: nuclear transport factor 2 family protein [Eudoraea sp.]|nr:nuclear transport factor 2 family protein [Muriicola sp.]NNE01555.1 nuclear transport factor 2 family protein [Eudoraea sp.]